MTLLTKKQVLLTKKQVAELLNCSERTVERLRAKGRLPAIAISGVTHKAYRWRQETIDQYLDGAEQPQPVVVLPRVRRAVKPKQTIPSKRFDWSKFYK